MPKTRDNTYITGTDSLVQELNFALQRIYDRLDKLEGLRNSLETEGGGAFKGTVKVTDADDTEIHRLS